jgi:hypothetical protein
MVASEGVGASLGAYLNAVGVWVWERGSQRYPNHEPLPWGVKDRGAVCVDVAGEVRLDSGDVVRSNVPPWTPDAYPNHTVLCSDAEWVWQTYVWRHVTAWAAGQAPFLTRAAALDSVWLPWDGGVVVVALQLRNATDGWRHVAPHNRSLALLDPRVRPGVRGEGWDGRPYPRLGTVGLAAADGGADDTEWWR